MNNSPIRFLDNDVLNYLLPEYVAKMRKKKWFEDLLNNLVRCYKGSYRFDLHFVYIFEKAYPVPRCDRLNHELMDFSSILCYCEGFLESKFNEEYNSIRGGTFNFDYKPSMDTDFIPFHNLFTELTGKFDPAQLSDRRIYNRFYPNLCEYYQYLESTHPHIKELKKEINLRYKFKNNVFFKMTCNRNKQKMIRNLFGIDMDMIPNATEKRELMKEKCEEIKKIKKSIMPYTKKLSDEDKRILIDALKNYYYIMNTVLHMGGDSVYGIEKHKKKIIKNIEKIKAM